MSTRLTADSGGHVVLGGLVPAHEYDVSAVDVTPISAPPPSGVVVPKVPQGVPGNWVNIFADAFAVPFGTASGQNNLWYPNRGGTNPLEARPGDNANELQVYSSSQVHQDDAGLHLRCEPKPTAGKPFLSGTIRTANGAKPAGYKLFKWTPTKGQAFVLETRWRLPATTGEEDPGFWSVAEGWGCEIDHPESWGFGEKDYQNFYRHGCPIWLWNTSDVTKYKTGHWVQAGDDNAMNYCAGVWHTFTTAVNADFTMDFYLDGIHKWKVAAPTSTVNRLPLGLVLSHALRGGHKYGPWPAPRNLDVRYVAVYTDSAHVGQNYTNGGVAPGTVLA